MDAAPPVPAAGLSRGHRMFSRASAALGANWSLHDLRHTAAYRMARDPAMPLTDVQWVLGHAQLSTTQLYLYAAARGRDRRRAGLPRRRPGRRRSPAGSRRRPDTGPESLDVLFGRHVVTARAAGRQTQRRRGRPRQLRPPDGRDWRAARRFPPRPVPAAGRRPASAAAQVWPGCRRRRSRWPRARPADQRPAGPAEACWTGWRPARRHLAGAVGGQRRRRDGRRRLAGPAGRWRRPRAAGQRRAADRVTHSALGCSC